MMTYYFIFQISNYSQTVPKANGLAFSVPFEMSTIPRTLQNIYKELEHDIGFLIPTHGCLKKWAQEGVLLLNEKLTVRQVDNNTLSRMPPEQPNCFTKIKLEKK
jgi:uracil DNA glycosylase